MNETQELQYLFDKSLEHIRKQGKPAYGQAEGMCFYRHPDGRTCAAAPFILVYNESMERNSFRTLIEQYPSEYFDSTALARPEFLSRLQRCHDMCAFETETFLTRYEGFMAELASDYLLEYTPP